MSRGRMLTALAALLLATAASHGHEVRPAYLELTETAPAEWQVLWKQPVLQDRRLPIDPVFPPDCEQLSPVAPELTGGALLERWQIGCDLLTGSLHISGLTRTLTDVMVKIQRLDGSESTNLLRASQPGFQLDDATPGVAAYFVLGVEHLVFGIDHVLFVIGLVLFISNKWMLLKTITAFTLAHSITLALSVLELVRLPQGPVEAVIALSILFLARELLAEEANRSVLTRTRPWIMALIFGLLHGFGFAGALADIGLPRDELALSLLLFNVGIEVGQIMIIAAVLALLWLGQRLTSAVRGGGQPAAEAQVVTLLVWGMGIMAAYWTIDRVVQVL